MDEHLRYHRWARRTLPAGGMMLAVALLPGFMVPGLGVLLLLWVLNGPGQALIGTPSRGLLADHTQPEERGRASAARCGGDLSHPDANSPRQRSEADTSAMSYAARQMVLRITAATGSLPALKRS